MLTEVAVVEPVHLFQSGMFDSLEAPLRATAVYDLGLEQSVDRFRQSIAVAVADASD